MHEHSLEAFTHNHHEPEATNRGEKRTRWVVLLTSAMMIGELIVGSITHSMALTADGWHMATHAGALGLAAFAYWFARSRAQSTAFSFGTGKVYALAGYTSAVALAIVAVAMMVESAQRLWTPLSVNFTSALPVAVVGLLVNIASVLLLGVEHDDHDHDHDHHHHHDHNLRAAYVHVMADALTSVLAIIALVAGKYLGFQRLDPLMGIVGGIVILNWGYSLCRSAGRQLLDVVPEPEVAQRIRACVESNTDARIADLHVWEIGAARRACIVSLVASEPKDVDQYRDEILHAVPLAHLTVEVHRCKDGHEPHA